MHHEEGLSALTELESRLGHTFSQPSLLTTALTHPSYGGDHHVAHYQRLEFLGDAVLELVISRYLYLHLPDVNEGRLTRLRASLVREETLFRAAQRIDLGRFIRLSVGEERSGGRSKASILSDVLESVFAAVYLDGGLSCAEKVILDALRDELTPAKLADHLDAKSRLQEILQRAGRMPVYESRGMEGPPHEPTFFYVVREGEETLGEGQGHSKQQAQQNAALDALKRMGALT